MNAEHALQRARENEVLFRRQIAAWGRNDLDELIDCYADNMTYTDMPFPDKSISGKQAFREYMENYNALFADGQVDVVIATLVANSENVVGELLCRAQYVGPGAPAGGVPVNWYATLVDTIVDDAVVSEHAYFDPTAFSRAVEQAAI